MTVKECKREEYDRQENYMTAEWAREILVNREQKQEDIQKKIMLLYQEMKQLEEPDELIAAAALPMRKISIASGRRKNPDNLLVLHRYYKQKRERTVEIQMQMWKLLEEAEDIRRLWSCFFVLQEPYYGILYDLYVKKQLYTVTEEAFGQSHRMFERRRKEGLAQLADLFNSPYNSIELMNQQRFAADSQNVQGQRI